MQLRCLARAALGIFNPEERFEKSEYYNLVQALFREDLFSLRDDVSILTYNYDPYLEFLLYRALETRFRLLRWGKSPFLEGRDLADMAVHNARLNAVTSGLGHIHDQSWLKHDHFSVLKLHGAISFVFEKELAGFDELVANKDNQPFLEGAGHNHWSRHRHSAAFATNQILNKIAPEMIKTGRYPRSDGQREHDLTLVEDFADFIKKHMKPVKLS